MARLARIVAPNTPHHVTQRGNRRQKTFFSDADYLRYLQLAAEWCAKADVECWGYCLMPNHVHLILTPKSDDAFRQGRDDERAHASREPPADGSRRAARRARQDRGTSALAGDVDDPQRQPSA